MGKPVMILPPHVRREQVVEGGNRCAPWNLFRRYLEPLGVLVEHRIHDVDKRFIGGKETVPTGEEISFEPALAGVLAEDFHHPSVWRQVVVLRNRISHPGPIRYLK